MSFSLELGLIQFTTILWHRQNHYAYFPHGELALARSGSLLMVMKLSG